MTDAKYFTTTKKGEIFELKNELNSDKKEKKREAVKKVIASMTVGKDVSALFPDVVNCMQTDNVELKKLVYLYLMNYAKSQPELAVMAVNTFVKDCEDPNPLIRALAVRTMGCIRVDKITEYLCEPLRKCMKDEDPYVRKTAAICVAKLHDINAQMVEDQGFVDLLSDLLSDSNPMVVANAVAAIAEINESRTLIDINAQTVNKLLTALNECTEWGQVFILDALSNYQPKDEREAQNICERISPRLAHANAAVVLSTVKVLMKLINMLPDGSDFVVQLIKKTKTTQLEKIKFIALKKPSNPIPCVPWRYATEVDVDFVRKAVRAIGRCAIKVEQSAERCVNTLLELIQTKVNYVVQEAVVVIKDIFRKYPNRYEGIISTLCENLDTLDEPEARASMIWIIGEYAERIDNADELLESFVEGFHDENTQVQLQLLTAVVKLFLKRPTDTQQLVQRVLTLATQDSDNPDLRDRGYIYWRLLSADPQAAKEVVLAEKPLISEETDLLEPSLLNQLVCHIGSLASVYHKPPSSFVDPTHYPVRTAVMPTSSGTTVSAAAVATTAPPPPTVIQPPQDSIIADLLNLDISGPAAAPSHASVMMDIFGSGMPSVAAVDAGTAATALNIFDVPSSSSSIFDSAPSFGLSNAAQQQQHQQGVQAPTAVISSTNAASLDAIFGSPLGPPSAAPSPMAQSVPQSPDQQLANLFGGLGAGTGVVTSSLQTSGGPYVSPYETWLEASKGKGLQIDGRWVRRGGRILAEMNLNNKALQPMNAFAVQFNGNSFGLIPSEQLSVATIFPNQCVSVSLPCNTTGTVQRMDPLTNLQVALKNNVDVFYFALVVPLNVYFDEGGQMDKRDFLQLWKEIPEQNELQFTVQNDKNLTADEICAILQQNNVFTVARRTVDGQELLYHSIKYTNQVYILSELKMLQNSQTLTLSLKSQHLSAIANLSERYQLLLNSSPVSASPVVGAL
uniref:AP complex subunit beta n=1 Tax=Globodera pallida TaxID=36090 RepID=A0A183C3Z3_GLOPA